MLSFGTNFIGDSPLLFENLGLADFGDSNLLAASVRYSIKFNLF